MPTARDGSRRIAAAVSVLTVIAFVIASALLALVVGIPDTWWPHAAGAFAADTAHHDPCTPMMGPATAYCEHGAACPAPSRRDVAAEAWRLLPAGAGAGAVVLGLLRSAAGQRWR
ncbi:hypothetical protein GCM10010394_46750 [Streptomyces crystallinus]|uniref:Integral membrane protein n=1 Tax=Streptomyces crystallinus TaxID=68191 RepID=A0ABP3RL30_9ACTN